MTWDDELPPPFVCVICRREIKPSPWHWQKEHNPPICNYCGTSAHRTRTRVPHMTRGDHRQLQRLAAISDALAGAAGVIEWEAKYGRFTA